MNPAHPLVGWLPGWQAVHLSWQPLFRWYRITAHGIGESTLLDGHFYEVATLLDITKLHPTVYEWRNPLMVS